MPLVSQRDKQVALRDAIDTAASRHKSGLILETHHRFAAVVDGASPRVRDDIMGNPMYYCEVLPSGSTTDSSYTAGSPDAVGHQFEVGLFLEYEHQDAYSGSTQETFDEITESISPLGVLPELRGRSVETVNSNPVTFLDPQGAEYTIQPIGERGGTIDRAHFCSFTITLTEPS